MRRFLSLALPLALVACGSQLLGPGFTAHAQTPAQTPASAQTPAPTPCPPTATLDQLIVALDDAVSGPANKDRACMKQLLLPNVRLIPVGPNGPHVLTLDDWIAAVAKNGDEIVTEHQIKVQSEAFGHIAHLWSTYTTTLAGKPLARGINSIQAVFDGQNWHVLQILWQAENATDQIPAQYLP
ncbi:MAG: hypothetical protein ABSA94_17495 [Acidobacteriaceae bacterium]|jgi:hypothetical protein